MNSFPFLLPLGGFLTLFLLMGGLWLRQTKTKDASIVDVAWTAGLGYLAIYYAFMSRGFEPRRILVAVLAGLWSFRLATYLYRRIKGKPEDGRYRALREKWGNRQQPYFFLIFQMNAILDVLFSLAFLPIVMNPSPKFHAGEYVAVFLWLLAVIGESLADSQLAKFRLNPENRGKTCRVGLWQYSRHPNYFFEWLHWWTYVAMGILLPFGWLTLIAPAVLLFLFFKVTGIPATEAQALRSRGEEYRQYQETVRAFFPWFPKKTGVR